MLALYRQLAEGAALCGTRLMLGDRRTADLVFSQDYDPGFTSRHTHQLAGLYRSRFDLEGGAR